MIGLPSQWIVEYAPLIRKGGRVLDVACGNGRHAIWLARQGYVVNAVDRDSKGMEDMLDIADIHVSIAGISSKMLLSVVSWLYYSAA